MAIALLIYKVVGEYFKDFWFRFFPSASLKKELKEWQHVAVEERKLRKSAELKAEQAIRVAERALVQRDNAIKRTFLRK